MDKYDVKYMNGGDGELLGADLSMVDAQTLVRKHAEDMHPEMAADLVIRLKPNPANPCKYQAALEDGYRPQFGFNFEHMEQAVVFMALLDWDIIDEEVMQRLNGSDGVNHYCIAQAVVFLDHHEAMGTTWGEDLEWPDESMKHYEEFMVPFLSEPPA